MLALWGERGYRARSKTGLPQLTGPLPPLARVASRGLTPPLGSGLLASKSFGERSGPAGRPSHQKLLERRPPRRIGGVTRRAAAKRRSAGTALDDGEPTWPRCLIRCVNPIASPSGGRWPEGPDEGLRRGSIRKHHARASAAPIQRVRSVDAVQRASEGTPVFRRATDRVSRDQRSRLQGATSRRGGRRRRRCPCRRGRRGSSPSGGPLAVSGRARSPWRAHGRARAPG